MAMEMRRGRRRNSKGRGMEAAD